MNAKQRLNHIAKLISENPHSEEHWKQAGLETVAVVRECVQWHTSKGRDPREVMRKILRVLDAITIDSRRARKDDSSP